MALAYGEKGRIPETIRHLKRATQLNPSWAQPHSDLGVALLLQGEYAEASRSLERAVELMPLRAESWNDLGATYLQLGRLEQAQQAFERAVTLKPTYAMAHYNLAQLLARLDRNREAIERLRLAVKAEPDSATFLENLAWFLATCPEDALRNGPEAVRLAEQVCRKTAYQQPSCLDALAAAYAEVGRFEEAVQTSELARRLAALAGDSDLARQIDERLDLYRSQHAYRSPLP
jgi:tetratricopeptide (TPR) repeat protein